MASLGERFSTEELPAGKSFDVIPAGWFNATIGNAELKKTKTGTGEYIAVRFDITGPTHQGRVVFCNLNIRNASSEAESIGRTQFGDILRSIGLAAADDTDQLVGGQLQIKVAVSKSDSYGERNDVKGFKAMTGAMPSSMPSSMPSAGAAAPAAAAAKAAPPWAKK